MCQHCSTGDTVMTKTKSCPHGVDILAGETNINRKHSLNLHQVVASTMKKNKNKAGVMSSQKIDKS